MLDWLLFSEFSPAVKAFALCSNCRLLDKILLEGVTVGSGLDYLSLIIVFGWYQHLTGRGKEVDTGEGDFGIDVPGCDQAVTPW